MADMPPPHYLPTLEWIFKAVGELIKLIAWSRQGRRFIPLRCATHVYVTRREPNKREGSCVVAYVDTQQSQHLRAALLILLALC